VRKAGSTRKWGKKKKFRQDRRGGEEARFPVDLFPQGKWIQKAVAKLRTGKGEEETLAERAMARTKKVIGPKKKRY